MAGIFSSSAKGKKERATRLESEKCISEIHSIRYEVLWIVKNVSKQENKNIVSPTFCIGAEPMYEMQLTMEPPTEYYTYLNMTLRNNGTVVTEIAEAQFNICKAGGEEFNLTKVLRSDPDATEKHYIYRRDKKDVLNSLSNDQLDVHVSVNIRKNSFPPEQLTKNRLEVSSDLGDILFLKKKYSDITFVTSCGTEFPAHRCILAARSLYFYNSDVSNINKRIVIDKISPKALTELFRFIYVGRIENLLDVTLAKELLASNVIYHFGIDTTDICEVALRKTILSTMIDNVIPLSSRGQNSEK